MATGAMDVQGKRVKSGEEIDRDAIATQVRGAVMWRSGSQVVSQLITWAATFLVIRMLEPEHYGLFAMTQVVLVFLDLMNGYGFASALVRGETVTRQRIAQAFGILLILNCGLATAQLLLAPLAAAYFREPLVADLLRVQALLYLTTPFMAIPQALLSRKLEFKIQAKVSLIAAALSAATAVGCAYGGLGVWTLVTAPMVMWWTRAIGLTLAARSLVWPSFRLRGAGDIYRFGGAMVLIQFFWFIQSQSDVFIAGRLLGAHELGIYTTALFLTQILASKFVPPLNEVAFAAYARIQSDRGAMADAFLKAVRLIMLIALPFYFGLAVTAEPLVLTVLGEKWAETIPIVPVLALAMPLLTLQILFAPATNALGHPAVALRVSIAGAAILATAFMLGVQFGIIGLAFGWLTGMALLTLVTAFFSLPVVGVGVRALARAVMPGLLASAAMAAAVWALGGALPPVPVAARLGLMVAAGVTVYALLLLLFARPITREVLSLLRRAPAAPAGA